MAVKFLPIHKQMRKCLKNGMRVVHNGGGSRQGWAGKIISTLGGNVTVFFVDKGKNQKYSWDWFLEFFHICVDDIETMKGVFNGKGYNSKYRLFVVSHSELKQKQRNTHADNKALADAKDTGYTSIVSDKNTDPLDEVGEFLLIHRGKVLGEPHKTQRLAEIAASKFTKENRCGVGILKLVSEAKPVCEAEIIRK
ncbi:hypothetical protein [Vibrio phage vB_ValA_R15Z]|uniref:Uncharacterized protein n=1 Tax=Vibrio phage vB_ValA_R15Z TaxID=3044218 RepID=A0AA49X7I4_9CAUD|nr:hypothetical protein [Vibrio phage vB_ValA_R15Z]